ncbi:hypothetical protein A5764_23340 [Mycobacterium sp. 852002-51057_SCH5723018]|nr:hypothetical protein A5764_23340 [Mycobacterium sp. 852002-51057_SCH5723018]
MESVQDRCPTADASGYRLTAIVGEVQLEACSRHSALALRISPTMRPINQHPLTVPPLNDANLMPGLHAGDRVDTKPTEQGSGIESL